MRKWKRPSIDDEEDEIEEDEDDNEEEEEERKYIARPLRVTRFSDFEEDVDDVEDHITRFNQIQGLIRAGKYKPKPSDPWIAHILYSNLKALGEI